MSKSFFTSIIILTIVGSVFSIGFNNMDSIQQTNMMDSNQNTLIQSPQTVKYVDLDKYIGIWYEIASIPAIFQRGCTKSMAKYSWNADKQSIKVENSCVRNDKQSKTIGKATPLDDTNAKLQLVFEGTPNAKSQYWIVKLGQDYQYAVVSTLAILIFGFCIEILKCHKIYMIVSLMIQSKIIFLLKSYKEKNNENMISFKRYISAKLLKMLFINRLNFNNII